MMNRKRLLQKVFCGSRFFCGENLFCLGPGKHLLAGGVDGGLAGGEAAAQLEFVAQLF